MEEQQLEENEMAMFMEVESARRHKVASGLGSTSYSPAAKLREVRAMGGELGGGSTERDEASACASTSSPPRPPRVESAPPKRSGLGKDARAGSCKDVRTASSFKQKRTPSQRAAAQPGPKPGLKRHQSSVEGLKERAQAEEKLARERERGQAAAKRILKEWCARTRGDAYSMMRSAHLFTDIFESDPLAGIELVNGNASSLKKCYHKLAAKLHPDRQRGNPTATQVLAEEVFKLITIAYQQESAKLLSV